MLWLIIRIVPLVISIASGVIVHPIRLILAVPAFFAGGRGRV